MKRFLAIVSLLFTFSLSHGQSIEKKLDSLYYHIKSLLNTDKELAYQLADSTLQITRKENFKPGIILMRHQIAQYLRFSDLFDSATNAYLDNKRLIGQYLEQVGGNPNLLVCAVLGVTYYDLAIIDYYRGSYDSSIQKTIQADSVYKKYVLNTSFNQNDVKNKLAVSAMLRAGIYQRTGDLSEAITITQETLRLYEEINRTDNVAIAYGNLGIMYNDAGRYLESIKAFEAGIAVAGQNGFEEIEATQYMTLAEMFQTFDETEKGFEYARKSKEITERNDNPYIKANVYSVLGELHLQLNEYDSAIDYHKRSLHLHQEMSNDHKIAYENERLANIFLKLKDFDKAYAFIKYGQEAVAKVDVVIEKLLLKLASMKYFLATDQSRLALNQIAEVLDLASHHENVRLKMEAYDVIHRAYGAIGQHELAYKYLLKYVQYLDSVFAENKGKEIAKVQYDIALENERQAMLMQQEREKLVFEQENQRKQWLIYSISVAMILIVIALAILYNSYKRKKADNIILNYHKETIEAKNEELEVKNEELQILREKDLENQKMERRLLQETIFLKERELAATAMINHEKNNFLSSIEEKLTALQESSNENVNEDIRQLKKVVHSNINSEDTWNSFIHQFEQVHPHFFHSLKANYPTISVNDLKLCAYIKVGMDNKQIASASNLTLATIKKNINRVKRKLGLNAADSIRDFLVPY